MTLVKHNGEMNDYLRALMDAGADIYEIGGPVRDHLMGRSAKDHDYLVRRMHIDHIQTILKPFGHVTLAGKSFGIIKFSPHRNPRIAVDFALPRTERSTGAGHRDFNVDFDPDLSVEEDLGRRDFTINAMARNCATGDLIDPFGGRADLDRRLLRQVFPRAFVEDPLRLVRAIQFAARLNLTIEEETWQSMRRHAPLISTVSHERIAIELDKLMDAEAPSRGFVLMRDSGLLEKICPELAALIGIEQDKMPGDDVFMHTMRVLDAARADRAMHHAGNRDLLFAALLHDIGKAVTARYHEPSRRTVFFGHQIASRRLARRWMQRMKLTTIGVDTERVCALIENHMFETKAFFTDRAIRRFIAKIGPDLIHLLIDLRLADNRGGKHPMSTKGVERLRRRVTEEMERKPPFGPRDLAVNGNDVMALGIPEGPAVGGALAALVSIVLDNPELNTREQLLALAANMRENAASPSTQPAQSGGETQGTAAGIRRRRKSDASARTGKEDRQARR